MDRVSVVCVCVSAECVCVCVRATPRQRGESHDADAQLGVLRDAEGCESGEERRWDQLGVDSCRRGASVARLGVLPPPLHSCTLRSWRETGGALAAPNGERIGTGARVAHGP